MFRTLVVVLFLAFSFNTFAQSTYEFLNLDQSPRAAALAGSFVANIDDPNVVFYNPAGIYNLKNSPASFSFTKHLVEINSASLTYSQEVSDLGRFAAAVQYINYGDFTEADEFGNKTGNFGAGELAMMIGYANQLGENFNYGANVKFIYSGIADQSSSGVALDLGLQYVLLESGWSFGFSVLNLGSQMSTYFDKSEDLPLDMKLGFSKKMAKVPFTFYGSFNRINEKQNNFTDRFKLFSFGGEFRFSKSVQARIGYDNNKRKEYKLASSTAGLAGFNIGLGILFGQYKFDYALSSLGKIGSMHRFGLSTEL